VGVKSTFFYKKHPHISFPAQKAPHISFPAQNTPISFPAYGPESAPIVFSAEKAHVCFLVIATSCRNCCSSSSSSATGGELYYLLQNSLNYCLGPFYLSVARIKDLAVRWSDCFRRCLALNAMNRLKNCNFCCKLLSEYLYDLHKWKFITNPSKIPDKILVLGKFQNTVLSELCCKYGDTCVLNMKRTVWKYFAKSLSV